MRRDTIHLMSIGAFTQIANVLSNSSLLSALVYEDTHRASIAQARITFLPQGVKETAVGAA